jgi:hypothetical protein
MRFAALLLLALATALDPAPARSMSTPRLGGYYKSFVVVFDPAGRFGTFGPSSQEGVLLGSVSDRLRLNGSWRPLDCVSLNLAYDLSPRVQDPALFSAAEEPLVDPFAYRADDLNRRLYPWSAGEVRSFAVMQNLDRATLSLSLSSFDVLIGRQAVAWGSARAVNPTDVVAPFVYNELDVEDRVGVDAVRVRVPVGALSELDAGAVFGDGFDLEEGAAFLRGRFYLARTDVSPLVVGFRENLLLGMDLARSVGGAGAWLEAAHVLAGALDERDASQDYFRLTVGADYAWGESSYGFLEAHFNGAGGSESEDYGDVARGVAFREGADYLLGRTYLALGVNRQVTPLLNLAFQMLSNLSDQSILFAPHAEYTVAPNVYLEAGAFAGAGSGPSADGPPGTEFWRYPDLYYTSFRLYF